MSSNDGESPQRGTMSGIHSGAVSVLGATGSIVLAAFIIIAAIGVPIAMVVIGAKNIDNCPAQNLIPIYLIIAGVTTIITVPVAMICGMSAKALSEDNVLRDCCTCVGPVFFGILSIFSLIWFFCGNVWVFRLYEPSYNVTRRDYCDETTYKFTFWVIIATYICAFLSCCFSCCFRSKSAYSALK